MGKLIKKIESSPLGAQVFRFARIAIIGVVASVVSGNPVTGIAILGAVEVAFRQVFPSVTV